MQVRRNSAGGFTLLEVLVAMAISGIILGIVSFQYLSLQNDVGFASQNLVSALKRVRSKALASTYFYTVKPTSVSRVTVTYAGSCSAPTAEQQVDTTLEFNLESPVAFTSMTWTICFTPRGITSDSATITIRDGVSGVTKSVEVVIGGAMRVL
jgi:prepilin-type N-terminal cleavage/methylation domain-containing protein